MNEARMNSRMIDILKYRCLVIDFSRNQQKRQFKTIKFHPEFLFCICLNDMKKKEKGRFNEVLIES
jgi:hypothetical protein